MSGTVAIHQPNYLPWLGYFVKMYLSDVFVFHDTVGFSKSGYTKRCKIIGAKGTTSTTWLSVPVSNREEGTSIKDIEIAEDDKWRGKHLRKIENAYASAPYFEECYSFLRKQLTTHQSHRCLTDLNTSLIQDIATQLEIYPKYVYSSELKVEGQKSALNLNIAKALEASVYVQGSGAGTYEDDMAFRDAGVKICPVDTYSWLSNHPYTTDALGFVNGLSIIDVLMHCGIEGTKNMIKQIAEESGKGYNGKVH